MENRRFFSYGCSFTSYAHPTWADLVGIKFEEYYNYGRPGAGNMYIFNALMESDQHHRIGKDDLVIIQWTCSSREDRYKDNNWICKGGVFNLYQKRKDFEKYFDFKGFVIRDLAAIKAAKKFLDYIGCEYYFLSMVPITTNNMYDDLRGQTIETSTIDAAEVYKDILDTIKSDYATIMGEYKKYRPKVINNITIMDNHPLPTEHYDYLEKVLPQVLPGPRDIAENLDRELFSIYRTHHQGWTYEFKDILKGKKNLKERL
jgi:hypothetical protein